MSGGSDETPKIRARLLKPRGNTLFFDLEKTQTYSVQGGTQISPLIKGLRQNMDVKHSCLRIAKDTDKRHTRCNGFVPLGLLGNMVL